MKKYILNDQGEPMPEPDIEKWSAWFEEASRTEGPKSRIVDRTDFPGGWVSTVFLGLDHNWSGEGPPILWESMIFGSSLDQEQDRCSGSREQAHAMHARMVAKLQPATK
jgi:hypothetical protein